VVDCFQGLVNKDQLVVEDELFRQRRNMVGALAPVPTARLVEDDVARHKHAPGHRVVDTVSLV